MAWDPTRDLLTMQERLESLFGRATTGWMPPADLAEIADCYIVTLELPGLNRADIDVHYADDTLSVTGQRPTHACCPERYQQLERGQGSFSRSFRFARPVSPDGITAELTDGVLTVIVPKRASDRRTVAIESST